FPCRDEHERRDASVGRGGALRDRNREGERLPRPCRRLGEDVEPRERIGQDQLLDSERFVDRASGERVGDGRGHAELAKRLLGHVLFDSLWVRDLPTSKHPKEEREAHLTGQPDCLPYSHRSSTTLPKPAL